VSPIGLTSHARRDDEAAVGGYDRALEDVYGDE